MQIVVEDKTVWLCMNYSVFQTFPNMLTDPEMHH